MIDAWAWGARTNTADVCSATETSEGGDLSRVVQRRLHVTEVAEIPRHEHRAEKASAAVFDRMGDEQVLGRALVAITCPLRLEGDRSDTLAPGERLVDQVLHGRVAAMLFEQGLRWEDTRRFGTVLTTEPTVEFLPIPQQECLTNTSHPCG